MVERPLALGWVGVPPAVLPPATVTGTLRWRCGAEVEVVEAYAFEQMRIRHRRPAGPRTEEVEEVFWNRAGETFEPLGKERPDGAVALNLVGAHAPGDSGSCGLCVAMGVNFPTVATEPVTIEHALVAVVAVAGLPEERVVESFTLLAAREAFPLAEQVPPGSVGRQPGHADLIVELPTRSYLPGDTVAGTVHAAHVPPGYRLEVALRRVWITIPPVEGRPARDAVEDLATTGPIELRGAEDLALFGFDLPSDAPPTLWHPEVNIRYGIAAVLVPTRKGLLRSRGEPFGRMLEINVHH